MPTGAALAAAALAAMIVIGGKTLITHTWHGVKKTPHVAVKTTKIVAKPFVWAGKRIATK
jgi:hypothetical protein